MPAQHLPVDVLIKYLATTNGRDKLYRVGQYYARFYVWYLQRNGASKDAVARWDALKSALGLSRRQCRPADAAFICSRPVLRVGKPVEHAQTLMADYGEERFLRCLLILRHADMGEASRAAAARSSLLLRCGVLCGRSDQGRVWGPGPNLKFHSVKVFNFKNFKIYQERAARFWLAGICLSWLTGFYQLRSIAQRFAIINRAVRANGPDPVSEEVKCEAAGLKKYARQMIGCSVVAG
ncbi:MAG: peroxisomal biogenesis factor 11-domain-containing protein, partial [Olpidium bornovanus]